MAKTAKKKLEVFDTVETAEDVIAADKDKTRQEEFQEANKRIAKIIPNYFLSQKKKRKGSDTDSESTFSQEIKVAPESIIIENNTTNKSDSSKAKHEQNKKDTEEKERE